MNTIVATTGATKLTQLTYFLNVHGVEFGVLRG